MVTMAATRRRAQSEATQRHILEAVVSLAVKHGLEGTTVSKVVAETGVPPSSIYWHFGSRDKLLAAAVEYNADKHRGLGAEWPDLMRGRAIPDAALDLVRSGVSPSRDVGVRLGLMLMLETRDKESLAHKAQFAVLEKLQERTTDWWQQVLEEAGWSGSDSVPHTLMRLSVAAVDAWHVASDTLPHDVDIVPLLARMIAGQARHLLEHPEDAAKPRNEPVVVARRHEVPAELMGRARWMEAAEQVVRERGIAGSTVAKICSRAELPASSLYWFFESKDELIAEVVADGYEAWSKAADWDPVDEGQLWASQSRWMRKSLAASASVPDIFRIGHMLLLQRDNTPALEAFLIIRARFVTDRARWFQLNLGLDPRTARDLAWAGVVFGDGVLIGQNVNPRHAAADLAPIMAAGLRSVIEDMKNL